MSRVIGIDLGTTNSCVAILEAGEPTVIHNQEGGRTTPSMVSWNGDGEVVVGAASKRQMVTNPTRTIFGAKRLIGRKVSDPDVQRVLPLLPYTVVAARNGDAWISIDDEARSPQEVSAHVLAKMRRVAEDYVGETITEAVITVPAYFDDVQRQATKDAGAIAGLTVRAIINEPTAAALSYGVQNKGDQRVAVFDLGGGTFDISILAIENGVFEVLSTSGDTTLGGDDFDRALILMLADEFQASHDVDLRGDAVALQRLKEAAEQAKIELSSSMNTDVNLPFIAIGPGGPIHLMRTLSRGELERACRELIERLAAPCATALELARCTPADIDQVLLVGGMTRMPAVQDRVIEIFGKPAHKGVNPDESVAMGAAVHSGVIGGELQEVVLLDVTPHDLGVKVAGDRMSVIIKTNTSIPTRESKVFATTEDNQTFVAIEVYQGAHAQASKNRRLGRFVLGDLRPGPRGATRVEVAFSLDADGILHVEATEVGTGRAASVTIEAASGLSADEVLRLGEGLR
ncbi:MAG: molecular chaperone DnaK [Kofleriaceae bacterium]|nr:molecular chaperone DnaK [Kofleriaceae bacterium]MCL4225664.1 molecular chaperone DnaK [Myxococcales bacterium]